MKKLYMVPSSCGVEMEVEKMIATSGSDVEVGFDETEVDANGAHSNGKNFWGSEGIW